MPNFVRTDKDEAEWSKAKSAAAESKGKSEGEFTDQDWTLANHIYHQIKKAVDIAVDLDDSESLAKTVTMLKEVNEKLIKQNDDEDPNELGEGYREFNPDDEESDAGSWLQENDPNYNEGEEDESNDGENDGEAQDVGYSDVGNNDEDGGEATDDVVDEAKIPRSEGDIAQRSPQSQEQEKKVSRFKQPTENELRELRAHTIPAEQRLRDKIKVKADPVQNPVLHQQGLRIEARELAHKDRKSAYLQLLNSPEYKGADPSAQMDMDDQFEKDWHDKNPEHIHNAVAAHGEAHQKGEDAQKVFHAAKGAAMEHMVQGGASPEESVSTEAALQHIGGAKGEEGTVGNITQDPSASFANKNPEFIKDLAAKQKAKGAQPTQDADELIQNYNPNRASISDIFGPEAAKNPKLDKFIEHHYPLINMNAGKAMRTLGLDPRSSEMRDSLVEPGLLGLMNAINSYDHGHPKKKSFANWTGTTMHGLMLSHLKNQDPVKHGRAAQKQYEKAQSAPAQPAQAAQPQPAEAATAPVAKPPVVIRRQAKDAIASHPAGKDMSERHARIQSQKAAIAPKKSGEE
jgi:hypothetical protein